jgi:hypothetical protein
MGKRTSERNKRENMDFIQRVQYEADEAMEHALWLVDNGLAGIVSFSDGETPYVAISFKERLWAFKGDKLILQAGMKEGANETTEERP